MVNGPPAAICRRKIGTTLPRLPTTLPKRTLATRVGAMSPVFCFCPSALTSISAMRLVAPIMLLGLTALSVEIMTNRSAPKFTAARAASRLPVTLFITASQALLSIKGTCL